MYLFHLLIYFSIHLWEVLYFLRAYFTIILRDFNLGSFSTFFLSSSNYHIFSHEL